MEFRGKTSCSKHSFSSETSKNAWEVKADRTLSLGITPDSLFVITWLRGLILSESITIFSSQLSRTGRLFATSFSLLLHLFRGTASLASKPRSLLCYFSAINDFLMALLCSKQFWIERAPANMFLTLHFLCSSKRTCKSQPRFCNIFTFSSQWFCF